MSATVLEEAIARVPALVVLVVVVVIFVKDRATSTAILLQAVNTFQEQVNRLFYESHENTKSCRDVQEANAAIVRQSAEAIHELLVEIRCERDHKVKA